jgi:hypothetical protein
MLSIPKHRAPPEKEEGERLQPWRRIALKIMGWQAAKTEWSALGRFLQFAKNNWSEAPAKNQPPNLGKLPKNTKA